MPENHLLPLVLLTHPLPPAWLGSLEGKCRLEVGGPGEDGLTDRIKSLLREADGLICMLVDPINAALLDQMPRLKVISNYAAGLDNIDLAECTRRGIPVGHTPGILTEATADLTMALLLAAGRGLFPAAADARAGRWKTWAPAGWLGKDLQGAVLGIVGMGQIGSAVARRAASFGLRIIYVSQQTNPEVESQAGARQVSLDELLAMSDFVSLHVPLTPQTRSMINHTALASMKKGAVLINTSRGPVVDLEALAQALETGQLSAAALDVTDPEPLPPDHRLFALPTCLILPHIGSATFGTRQGMAAMACDNLLAGLENRRLPVCANPEVYA